MKFTMPMLIWPWWRFRPESKVMSILANPWNKIWQTLLIPILFLAASIGMIVQTGHLGWLSVGGIFECLYGAFLISIPLLRNPGKVFIPMNNQVFDQKELLAMSIERFLSAFGAILSAMGTAMVFVVEVVHNLI